MPEEHIKVTLRQITVPPGSNLDTVRRTAARKIGCKPADFADFKIVRRSLDARRNRRPAEVYSAVIRLPDSWRDRLAGMRDIAWDEPKAAQPIRRQTPKTRPVVAGAGPAGLFAALRLAESGCGPIVLERGDPVEKRLALTDAFWRMGTLDPESNALFGEGGAGLFSDGKLNTRHKDRHLVESVLRALVDCGAPESILLDAEPHVGTDLLSGILVNLRNRIISLGGEFRFRSRLDGLTVQNGRLTSVSVAGSEAVATDALILAVGHSARDVYALLANQGVPLAAKPFAMGIRVQMPQEAVNHSQWNMPKPPPGAAAFRLTRKADESARACYSFCMCPGGTVVACASEEGFLACNGMSRHARDSGWANAAFLVPVTPADFLSPPCTGTDCLTDPPGLAGIEYQRHWEKKAFLAGGGDYSLPGTRLTDFLTGCPGDLPDVGIRAVSANLRDILPLPVTDTLLRALPEMLGRLRKVRREDVVLFGVETRSSSPVRIIRGIEGESTGVRGLYPAGEGAGYAGGIVTSAIDGWRAAASVLQLS